MWAKCLTQSGYSTKHFFQTVPLLHSTNRSLVPSRLTPLLQRLLGSRQFIYQASARQPHHCRGLPPALPCSFLSFCPICVLIDLLLHLEPNPLNLECFLLAASGIHMGYCSFPFLKLLSLLLTEDFPIYYLMPGLSDTIWEEEYSRWLIFSRHLNLIPLDTKALVGKLSTPNGKLPKMYDIQFSVLKKSTCFSGCQRWVTIRNSSCHLCDLGDGRWAVGLGSTGLSGPLAQEAIPLPDHSHSGFSRYLLLLPLALSPSKK